MSRGMYSGHSTLCYGVQWDTALNFIDPGYTGYAKDSTGMGWYADNYDKTTTGNVDTNLDTLVGKNLIYTNKEIIKKPIFNNELKNCIKEVYKKTYNKNNIDYFYTKGIKHAKIFNTLIVNDRFGIKKFIYKIIDFLTNHHWGYLSVYSTYIKKPNLNYLNLEHKEWNHPSIKELKYTHSFEDLYNNSLEKSLKIIREVNKVLYENKKIEDLLKVILNVDYATGLLINDTRKMDYFEY